MMLGPESDSASPVLGVLTERTAQLQSLKKNLEAAQDRMKVSSDKQPIERQFQVGDVFCSNYMHMHRRSFVNGHILCSPNRSSSHTKSWNVLVSWNVAK